MTINLKTGKELYGERGSKKFSRPKFLVMDLGPHTVRILGEPHPIFVHFFRGKGNASVKCLGKDCPICQSNKEIRAAYPEDYRKQTNYNASQLRHYLNVFDRTVVKVCPECQNEHSMRMDGTFPPKCSCNASLLEVESAESNKVKIANLSDTCIGQLVSLQLTTLNQNKEPIGLENFDVILTAMMIGDRKNTFPSNGNRTDVVEYAEEDLYDLDNAVISLTAEEIITFLSGVSLKDIFAARKTATSFDAETSEALAVVADATKELFNH